jgi:hypothetical protein
LRHNLDYAGRQEKVDFSNPVFVASGGVLVLEKSGIQGLISIADKGVALEQIFVRWFGLDAQPSEALQALYLINAYPD